MELIAAVALHVRQITPGLVRDVQKREGKELSISDLVQLKPTRSRQKSVMVFVALPAGPGV